MNHLEQHVARRRYRGGVDAFERNLFHGFAGSDAKMMDRLSRLVPERAAKLIQKQMASLLG